MSAFDGSATSGPTVDPMISTQRLRFRDPVADDLESK